MLASEESRAIALFHESVLCVCRITVTFTLSFFPVAKKYLKKVKETE